jgi:hypothetical protein
MGRVSAIVAASAPTAHSLANVKATAQFSVDGSLTLINESTTELNRSFDKPGHHGTFSFYGSTSRVDTFGEASAMGSHSYAATASVRNGHALALYGDAAYCRDHPEEHGAVWDYGTTQGSPQLNSLRQELKDYFLVFWNYDAPHL